MVKLIVHLIFYKNERARGIILSNYFKMAAVAALIGTSLLLASCTEEEKSEPTDDKPTIESITETFEHPETKQKFKIVNAYELYENYGDEVEKNPDQPPLKIYEEEVINPINNACFKGGEYPNIADLAIDVKERSLPKNQALSEKINREETENIIKEALFKSADLLPSKKETTVCVLPATDVGPGAVNVGTGKITLLYSKYHTPEGIKALIAHEYHHSVWTEKYQRNDVPFTVLDNLIFEGKAVMFEKAAYPDIDLTPVDLTYQKVYWSEVEGDLEKADLNRSLEIVWGGNGLPTGYGYSEGYKMVKSYLDLYPDTTPEEWTALDSKVIFEKGNYLKNYQ
jgi:hypothetical protein